MNKRNVPRSFIWYYPGRSVVFMTVSAIACKVVLHASLQWMPTFGVVEMGIERIPGRKEVTKTAGRPFFDMPGSCARSGLFMVE